MKVEMKITPLEPEVRTLADVPENVLCRSGTGADSGLMWRGGSSSYSFGVTGGAFHCCGVPSDFPVSEVFGKFKMRTTGTGRDRKFELVIDWPEEPEPKTLADVDEGVACLDRDGDISWKHGDSVFYARRGKYPIVSSYSPKDSKITKVLGKIAFHWENEG